MDTPIEHSGRVLEVVKKDLKTGILDPGLLGKAGIQTPVY